MPRKKLSEPYTYGYVPSNLDLPTLQVRCKEAGLSYELILLFYKFIINKSHRFKKEFEGIDLYHQAKLDKEFLYRLFGRAKASQYKAFLREYEYVWIYPNSMSISKVQDGVPYDYYIRDYNSYQIPPAIYGFDLFRSVQGKLYTRFPIFSKTAANAERNAKEFRREQIAGRLGGTVKPLSDMLKGLRIDLESERAEALISELDLRRDIRQGVSYSYYDLLCAIESRDIEYYKKDSFGKRFHHTFQTIKKELRSLMYFEGRKDERLVFLDWTASQPWLLSQLNPKTVGLLVPEAVPLLPALERLNDSAGFEDFSRKCLEGTVYYDWTEMLKTELGDGWQDVVTRYDEEMAEKYGERDGDPINEMDSYSAAKSTMYRILYGGQGESSPVSKTFRSRWPEMFDSMKDFKKAFIKHNHSEKGSFTNLVWLMQRFEAAMMERIMVALWENGINHFVPIYDSFGVCESEADAVESIMKETVSSLGITPAKIKRGES